VQPAAFLSTTAERLGRLAGMTVRTASLILIVSLLMPAPPAVAAPRQCFTPKEAESIQSVRHGIRLRESALRCQEEGYASDTLALWRRVDQAVGSQFKAETDLRREAFQREFESWADWNLSIWDGRIVMHFRNRPLSRELCTNIATMLKDIDTKGWAAFTKQATKLRNEIRLDYMVCRK